jgi:hypothetical protein
MDRSRTITTITYKYGLHKYVSFDMKNNNYIF